MSMRFECLITKSGVAALNQRRELFVSPMTGSGTRYPGVLFIHSAFIRTSPETVKILKSPSMRLHRRFFYMKLTIL